MLFTILSNWWDFKSIGNSIFSLNKIINNKQDLKFSQETSLFSLAYFSYLTMFIYLNFLSSIFPSKYNILPIPLLSCLWRWTQYVASPYFRSSSTEEYLLTFPGRILIFTPIILFFKYPIHFRTITSLSIVLECGKQEGWEKQLPTEIHLPITLIICVSKHLRSELFSGTECEWSWSTYYIFHPAQRELTFV